MVDKLFECVSPICGGGAYLMSFCLSSAIKEGAAQHLSHPNLLCPNCHFQWKN